MISESTKLLIRCRRMDTSGFVLFPDVPLVDMLEWKQKMFAGHAASFYGTTLDLHDVGERHGGILLPDLIALDYFSRSAEGCLAQVEWDPVLRVLMKVAPLYSRWVSEGRFRPDYDQWLAGRFGWTPVPEESEQHEWRLLQEEAVSLAIDYLDEWLDGVISALLGGSEEAADAWNGVASAYPLAAVIQRSDGGTHEDTEDARRWMDEEDWLISIGWKQDEAPFRVALRLAEPDDHTGWELQTVLQDKDNPGAVFAMPSPWEESVDVPPAWQPYVGIRLEKERNRWLRAAPGLTQPEQPGELRRLLTDEEAWEFLVEDSIRLAEAGANVLLPGWWDAVKEQRMRLKAKVRSSVGSVGNSMFGIDSLVQFDWRLAVGDVSMTEDEFRRLAEEKRRLVRVGSQWVLLDPAMLEQIRKLMKRVEKRRGMTFREVLELHLLGGEDIAAGEVPDAGERDDAGAAHPGTLRLEVELNGHLSKMVSKLQHTSGIPITGAPAGFHGEMRKYQLEGLSWLSFLQQFGLGGCLADDMGLGKTIQWIAYVQHLREAGRLNGPALLICPTSVIGNWQMELERFAPELNVHLHYGSKRLKGEAFAQAAAAADVVITSYTLSHLDETELGSLEWSTLCLDEAQNIKNAYTKQAGAIRRLNARHRVALTGTPIENRLTELWSIFDFINPGYLSTLGEFRRTYVSAVERGDTERIAQVQMLVRPFLLRRVKKDPAIQLDLPDKNEMKTYVPLTVEQGALYETIVQDMFDKLDKLTPMERRGLILATLTRLKQVCDHPALLSAKAEVEAVEATATNTKSTAKKRRAPVNPSASAKLERLLEMVEELREEGDQCLIFTQYVEMGHILKSALEETRGEPVLFLHGGVPKAKRDEMIAQFQGRAGEESGDAERTDDSTSAEVSTSAGARSPGIFILSLKAGGTGLNLTAANHVFHFDRWWNPAVENQATDRAFRIGQTRDVQVHKFITLGTLEERIDQMIDKKQDLSQQIIGSGENWITELSTTELRELFTLRRQWLQE